MAMIAFKAMDIAMPQPCDGYDMSVIINMVMGRSWEGHGHGRVMAMAKLVGRGMTSAKHIGKAISLANVRVLCKIKVLAKVMMFSIS